MGLKTAFTMVFSMDMNFKFFGATVVFFALIDQIPNVTKVWRKTR